MEDSKKVPQIYVDFIANHYSKMQNSLREKQVEETAELVIEKLKLQKISITVRCWYLINRPLINYS